MGYRYTDNEIERLEKNDVYGKALRAARAAGVHIEPSRDDYESIEFLANVFDVGMFSDIEDLYELGEFADDLVPYNNYKCGMVFSQLGLWYDRMQTTLDQDYIDGIRYILYDTALTAMEVLIGERDF